jgi:hypothetical protein
MYNKKKMFSPVFCNSTFPGYPSLVTKMRHILLGNLRKSSQQKKTMHTAITDVVKSHSSSLFLVSTTLAETFILAADTNMKTKER